MRSIRSPKYGADLAHVHDQGFGALGVAAARFVARFAPRVVVDVGCGAGAATRVLLDDGRDVFGFEPSSHLLALARRRAPGATLTRAGFATARLPACDAVLAAGEVLGYATERRSTWADVRRFFARAHAALSPRGVLVFDLPGPGRVPGGHAARHAAGRDWLVVSDSAESSDHRTLTRRITTFRRVGRTWRRRDEVHRLRLHAPAEVLAALRDAGFTARRLAAYPGLAPAPGLHVYCARPRRPWANLTRR